MVSPTFLAHEAYNLNPPKRKKSNKEKVRKKQHEGIIVTLTRNMPYKGKKKKRDSCMNLVILDKVLNEITLKPLPLRQIIRFVFIVLFVLIGFMAVLVYDIKYYDL